MEKKKRNNNEIEVRCLLSDIRIEKRSEDESSRTVIGYAAKFEKWSEPILGWFMEQIQRGAFDDCDMTDCLATYNHNVDDVLARTLSKTLDLTVDDIGLRFSFEAPNTTKGNDMLELIRRGDINKCSFRFCVEQDEWIYADEENGLTYDKRTILKISKLYDVALVVFPAYNDTEASIRRLEKRKAQFLEKRNRRRAVGNQNNKNQIRQKKPVGKPASKKADRIKAESESRKRLVEVLRRRN